MIKTAILFAAATHALSAPVAAQPPADGFAAIQDLDALRSPGLETQASAIRSLLTTFERGWSACNASMVSTVYADAAELVISRSEVVQGRASIEAYLSDRWAAGPDESADCEPMGRLELWLHHQGRDTMIFYGRMQSRPADEIPGPNPGGPYSSFVIQNTGNEWQVVRQHLGDAPDPIPR